MYSTKYLYRPTVLFLMLAGVLILATQDVAVGQNSPYYLVDGDSNVLQIDQTGSVTNSWNTGDRLYPIAVTNTIKLYGILAGSTGAEFQLDGTPTGVTYPWQGGPTGQLLDGTTDTVTHNYATEWSGGQGIWQYDLDWNNPSLLFTTSIGTVGITYDLVANSLWISQDQGNIQQVDNAGNVLGEFDPGPGRWGALAWEPATDTLWAHNNSAGNVIAQWQKDGTLIQTITVSGLAGNIWGGEFQLVPEPTTLALVGLGLSFIAMRRRR